MPEKKRHKTVFEVEKGQRTMMRRHEVELVTGLSRSSIYARMNSNPPTFPVTVPLGGKSVGWVRSEIFNFIEERISIRDSNVLAKAGENMAVGAGSVQVGRV